MKEVRMQIDDLKFPLHILFRMATPLTLLVTYKYEYS